MGNDWYFFETLSAFGILTEDEEDIKLVFKLIEEKKLTQYKTCYILEDSNDNYEVYLFLYLAETKLKTKISCPGPYEIPNEYNETIITDNSYYTNIFQNFIPQIKLDFPKFEAKFYQISSTFPFYSKSVFTSKSDVKNYFGIEE
jgi:hypothetical protein